MNNGIDRASRHNNVRTVALKTHRSRKFEQYSCSLNTNLKVLTCGLFLRLCTEYSLSIGRISNDQIGFCLGTYRNKSEKWWSKYFTDSTKNRSNERVYTPRGANVALDFR